MTDMAQPLDARTLDLLTALRDLLDVPLQARWEDREAMRDLTRERQFTAYLILDDLVDGKGPAVQDPVLLAADVARKRLAGMPVTYPTRTAA